MEERKLLRRMICKRSAHNWNWNPEHLHRSNSDGVRLRTAQHLLHAVSQHTHVLQIRPWLDAVQGRGAPLLAERLGRRPDCSRHSQEGHVTRQTYVISLRNPVSSWHRLAVPCNHTSRNLKYFRLISAQAHKLF